ncbi:GNAT family N-acetyltransferase [Pseudanabaena sp. FACHB-2040]|uniref:GNAT family N-acetyltransferase n=1 Tax=Pseudanabaena sp. FACHB-2040 TaxID=2692859 RepID=UPI0018EF8176|nr:GNAT family N-acetyltransferase [Pseudanabaena sp. FACHB-2040]
MMENITRASLEDAVTLLELQKLAYQSEALLYNDFNIPPLAQSLDEMRSDITSKVFLKASIKGNITGSVRGYQEENVCFIGRLIVHPDFQGQGIGTALMVQIESCFDRVQRFQLFTGHKSERNIHLYERLGYKIFKKQKINKNLSLLFMEKYQSTEYLL